MSCFPASASKAFVFNFLANEVSVDTFITLLLKKQ